MRGKSRSRQNEGEGEGEGEVLGVPSEQKQSIKTDLHIWVKERGDIQTAAAAKSGIASRGRGKIKGRGEYPT